MRCGVKLTREYIQYLNDEINRPKEENQLKNEYLKAYAELENTKKRNFQKIPKNILTKVFHGCIVAT